MTWTYNPVTIATTPKDQVRLMVGDTDSTDPLLQDEEITFLLTLYPTMRRAAAYAAESIAASLSRLADYKTGQELSEMLSQKAQGYRALATRLMHDANLHISGPIWGGSSLQSKVDDAQDSDAVQPFFYRDMQEEPGTAPGVQFEGDAPYNYQ